MTFEKLKELISAHNIPDNVVLRSDSGWECGATEMDGVYYLQERNEIVFTQDGDGYVNHSDGRHYIYLT